MSTHYRSDLVRYAAILALLAVVWFLPNSHQIMGNWSPSLAKPQPTGPAFLRCRTCT